MLDRGASLRAALKLDVKASLRAALNFDVKASLQAALNFDVKASLQGDPMLDMKAFLRVALKPYPIGQNDSLIDPPRPMVDLRDEVDSLVEYGISELLLECHPVFGLHFGKLHH